MTALFLDSVPNFKTYLGMELVIQRFVTIIMFLNLTHHLLWQKAVMSGTHGKVNSLEKFRYKV